MHWKTKQKVLTTTKMYLTEDRNSDYYYEIRLQLPDKKYILIDLRKVFPLKIYYKKLSPNGFNYDPQVDDQIIKFGLNDTLTNLENSKKDKRNNKKTIETLIDLINEMENFI